MRVRTISLIFDEWYQPFVCIHCSSGKYTCSPVVRDAFCYRVTLMSVVMAAKAHREFLMASTLHMNLTEHNEWWGIVRASNTVTFRTSTKKALNISQIMYWRVVFHTHARTRAPKDKKHIKRCQYQRSGLHVPLFLWD